MKKHLQFILLWLLGTLFLVQQAQAQSCGTISGLVAQYSFEETNGTTTREATGQQGPGVLTRGPYAWQPSGGYDNGGALALTGNALLDIPLYWTPSAFSFSFWIKRTKPTSQYDYGQITGSTVGWGAFLFIGTATGGVYAGTDNNHPIALTTSQVLQIGVWQHFVFTFNNGEGILYKNGQVIGRRTDMPASKAWQGIELGSPTDAVYDELRVYNRAVSAQEAGLLAGRYEAELPAPQVQLTQANIGSSNGVSYAENLTSIGSRVAFSVSVPTAGMYRITSRYASALEYVRTMSLYVNNVDVTQAQFPTTGSWASWSTQSAIVPLRSGCNTLAYTYDADDNGSLNLDYIDVKPDVLSGFKPGSAASATLPPEIGVDKFTGTAAFNASLYTVTIPGFSLPLALHYSATGVQVDDVGGEVGLNWSLQAAPSIRRQVRDLPDDIKLETSATSERRYGWLRYPSGSATPGSRIAAVPNVPATINAAGCTPDEQTAWAQLTSLGSLNHSAGSIFSLYDTEPDIFTYEVPGYAGKFVFDETGAVRLIPYAPIQITPVFSAGTALPATCAAQVPTGELAGFTLKTAEGVLYTFYDTERISQQTQVSAYFGGAKYLLRHFWDFKIRQDESGSYTGPVNTSYTTGWLATQITTPVAANSAIQPNNTISFQYACSPYIPRPDSHSIGFLVGNSSALPSPDNNLVTIVASSPKLAAIKTATSLVTFSRTLNEFDDFHLSSVVITSPLENNSLIKSYNFKYRDNSSLLASITLNRAASSLTLYSFLYERGAGGPPDLAATITGLKINKDYWGFANDNRVFTGIPKLYIYPQLLTGSSARPAAPYRLYPVPAYQSGGTVLSGADRRPATRLSVAVAGTLSRVIFATGGQVGLEYEQNQFYDPVAQQSLPAGGLRIRAIRVLDPVTQVESRRDYSYQETTSGNAGVSSGVLLHLPRFAFAIPLATSTQWPDVTVRSTEELAVDPFESRVVGYRQVTESVLGKGQVTTVFSVPGGADDLSSAANPDSNLPEWRRPVFGIARQQSAGTCPATAPLQTVSDSYPFAPAPNYDFCRGLPLTILYRAEPALGTALGPLVRQENYTYQYVNARPGSLTVTGLRYEQLGDPATPLYAYAKYSLLTDFFYATRQQVTQLPVAGGATNQTTIGFRYNNQGWLAAKIIQGSDNTLTRTRYKYLSDYALPASGASGPLQAMVTRVNAEGIRSDIVETISEYRPAGSAGRVAYAGATLQTFTTGSVLDANNNPVITPTYSAQLRRWLPAQLAPSYDSVRIVNNTLYIPAALREVSSNLAVNANLTSLTSRTQAGRQLVGTHVGYAGTLPLLRITGAAAAEVIFSDFETTDNPNSFKIQFGGTNPTYTGITSLAARTGKSGLRLSLGDALVTNLPVSTAPQYRLVFWVKATTALTSTVTIGSGQATAFTRPVTYDGSGQWRRCELLLPFANLSNRSAYQLSITTNSTLQLDDVLLLPADASAASTTYDLAVGKTSETDERGRTTFYEYGPTGDLALVRDQNQAIVHQYQKILPGRTITAGISFTTSGTQVEGTPVAFTASSSLKGPVQYKWDFGDGTVTGYSNSEKASHSYALVGINKTYSIRLYVTSQGTEYLYSNSVGIKSQPLLLTTCTAGVVAIDDCTHKAKVDTGCNPNAPDPNGHTTFQVFPSLQGNFTYAWEQVDPTNPTDYWHPIDSNPNDPASLTITRFSLRHYRCWVSRVGYEEQKTLSEEFGIDHYRGDPNCPQ